MDGKLDCDSNGDATDDAIPYIDTDYFEFYYTDGHLKSYADGYYVDGTEADSSISAGVRAVRGEEDVYGVNDFTDNEDNTISDNATGLMWSKYDSGTIDDNGNILLETDDGWCEGRSWTDTLAWVEDMNTANYGGYSDWRLPDIKELQSIV